MVHTELYVSLADDDPFPFGVILGDSKIKLIKKSKYFTYNSLISPSTENIPLNFEIRNSSLLFYGHVNIHDTYEQAINNESIESFEGKTQLMTKTGRPGPFVIFQGSVSVSNSPIRFHTPSKPSKSISSLDKGSPPSTFKQGPEKTVKPLIHNEPPLKSVMSPQMITSPRLYPYIQPSITTSATPESISATHFSNTMTQEIYQLTATVQHIINKQNQVSRPNERLFVDPNYVATGNLAYLPPTEKTSQPSSSLSRQTPDSRERKKKKEVPKIPRCALPENNVKKVQPQNYRPSLNQSVRKPAQWKRGKGRSTNYGQGHVSSSASRNNSSNSSTER